MERLHQDEIIKLKDKNLRLRYLLGGLNSSETNVCQTDSFWTCDIRCSCTPVPDDHRLLRVKDYIKRHNISNETFMKILLNYLNGCFVKYNGEYGELISELDEIIVDYQFHFHNIAKPVENDLKERELLILLENCGQVNQFLKKYSLTPIDFMVLAKTSVNYHYLSFRYSLLNILWRKDLFIDLITILKEFNLYDGLDVVKEYRRQLEAKKEKTDTDQESHGKRISFFRKDRSNKKL